MQCKYKSSCNKKNFPGARIAIWVKFKMSRQKVYDSHTKAVHSGFMRKKPKKQEKQEIGKFYYKRC